MAIFRRERTPLTGAPNAGKVGRNRDSDLCFFIDDMCVVFILNLFLVSLGLYVDIYLYIYIVKRRRPCFVGAL